jgi:hypothetical protein
MLRASHILIAHEDATRSQRNVSREEALFLIADIQKKLLDKAIVLAEKQMVVTLELLNVNRWINFLWFSWNNYQKVR